MSHSPAHTQMREINTHKVTSAPVQQMGGGRGSIFPKPPTVQLSSEVTPLPKTTLDAYLTRLSRWQEARMAAKTRFILLEISLRGALCSGS